MARSHILRMKPLPGRMTVQYGANLRRAVASVAWTRLGEDETCTRACILDAEVHHRLRYARDCKLFELPWRQRFLHAPRGNDDDSDDELAIRVVREQQESRPCGNFKDRLIPRRIQMLSGPALPNLRI